MSDAALPKSSPPNPVFRPLPLEAFAAFAEPDNVKIAWAVSAPRRVSSSRKKPMGWAFRDRLVVR